MFCPTGSSSNVIPRIVPVVSMHNPGIGSHYAGGFIQPIPYIICIIPAGAPVAVLIEIISGIIYPAQFIFGIAAISVLIPPIRADLNPFSGICSSGV